MFRYPNIQIVLKYLLIAIFGIFLTRTVDLMIVRGAYYRSLADNNRVRRINILSARGGILTRDGQELAQNNIVYYTLGGKEVSRQKALTLESAGVELLKKWVREYPFGEMTAHLTGYLGEAAPEEVSRQAFKFGSIVGRGGLEEYYDQWLRGEDGERVIEVGVNEAVIRELGKKDPVPGEDLIVSLDLNWQQAAWEAMQEKKGGVIVLDPDNGSILAMVSYPSYDPNLFTLYRDDNKINQILNDDQLPMLNRTIGGAYPPGSTFKIVTGLAGLEEKKIDADKEVEDTGIIRIGEWSYANWLWTSHGRTDGMVNLVKAIQRSNDIYFYKVGEWLGINSLVKWARTFNFGQKTGIDLPAEVSGLLPTPEWKKEVKGEAWFLGNTYHVSIGQGDLTVTPLQVALETAVIANGGKLCRPHLSLSHGDSEKDYCKLLDVSKEHIELIRQGMYAACQPGGTAPVFYNQDNVACKTGTSQISKNVEDTHAWFTLFYQPKCPKTSEVAGTASCEVNSSNQVVITVFLERGGGGASDAAPVAKEIIDSYQDLL